MLVVGKEFAPTTGTEHYHCLLVWETAVDYKDVRKFDIEDVHPNWVKVKHSAKDLKRTFEYCIKSDTEYLEENFVNKLFLSS